MSTHKTGYFAVRAVAGDNQRNMGFVMPGRTADGVRLAALRFIPTGWKVVSIQELTESANHAEYTY